MVRAFFDMGLDYDNLYGASVGALNGMLVHQQELDKMGDLWLKVKTEDVYNSNIFTWANIFTEKACFFDSSPLKKLIDKNLNVAKLKDNPRKFYVNTTSFKSWTAVYYDCKDLDPKDISQYLRASSAAPVGFEPIKLFNDVLVDGGIISNFNISRAVADGMDTIVVMTPTVKETGTPISNIFNVLDLMGSVPPFGYLQREINAVEHINKLIDIANIELEHDFRKIKLVVVRPPKPTNIGLLDFNYKQDRKELIQYGYDLAKEILTKELLS